MTTNYPETRRHLEARLAQLGTEIPGPMSGFARMHKKAVEDGALSGKVKEIEAKKTDKTEEILEEKKEIIKEREEKEFLDG